MVLTVLTDNAPELLTVSTPVEDVDSVRELAKDMIETMIAYKGIGLAAPQVGVNKRVIIVKYGQVPVVMINPVITRKNGFYVSMEGCLSVPNRRVKKTRSKMVTVEFQNLDGGTQTMRLNGLEAACVQHEIDHLDGILIAN